MTQAVLFTALIPIALLAVLGLVLISGRLKAGARDRIERLLTVMVYPALVFFWAWEAWDSAQSRDWLLAAGFAFAAACMMIQAAILIRRRGLPWSHGPNA